MDDFYREVILDHYKHPRNKGRLDPRTSTHEEDNPLCGDRIRIDLLVKDDMIEDVRFTGQGCAISQASASMLTEAIKGMSVADAKNVDKQFILDLIGIPLTPARLKCALLSLKVFKVGAYGLSDWHEDDEE